MTISAALAAALAVLTDALDNPETDIASSLHRLSMDAASAVPSYCGLSVLVPQEETTLTINVLTDSTESDDVSTSLHVALGDGGRRGGERSGLELILYATTAGAFVDLAADFAWLTDRPLREITLDNHLSVPTSADFATQLGALSDINQAIGVLIGHGHTPDDARRRLQVIAEDNRTDRHAAARLVLANNSAEDQNHLETP